MTYRTILLHLACDAGHMARIDAAADLAGRFKAHVTALFIASPVSMPAEIEGRAASAAFIEEATAIARERGDKVREACAKRFGELGVTFEWKEAEGDHLDLLAAEAPYADLAIVSHSKVELIEDRVVFHVPEHLPLVVGCPVVVMPAEGARQPVGRHVLVAWKPTTEAARAVNLALPLLHDADEVTIFSVLAEPEAEPPGARLAAHLARHGIAPRVVTDASGTQYAGEAILAKAREVDADAIVMGAYGHSRLREMVLGGVTRHVLMNAKVPMLLAH
jgi:nucleotide-binding universal stress UspA family protein